MEISELKIGNRIYIPGLFQESNVIGIVESISKDEVKTDKCDAHVSMLRPIPLTEEFLFLFGFEKKSWFTKEIVIEFFYYQLHNFIVYLLPNSFEVEIITKSGEQFNLYRNWNYVHELQNIYFIFERKIN